MQIDLKNNGIFYWHWGHNDISCTRYFWDRPRPSVALTRRKTPMLRFRGWGPFLLGKASNIGKGFDLMYIRRQSIATTRVTGPKAGHKDPDIFELLGIYQRKIYGYCFWYAWQKHHGLNGCFNNGKGEI